MFTNPCLVLLLLLAGSRVPKFHFQLTKLFSLPQKMFTRLSQDTNDLLFFYDYDAMLQKCAHHLAPPTSVVTVSDQSIYNKMKQLATVRK